MKLIEVENIIKSFLEELSKNKNEDINKDTHLVYNLGLSSIDMIKLVVRLEEHFNIEIPAEEINIERFQTYGNVVNYLKEVFK